jgi:hypothetical protein
VSVKWHRRAEGYTVYNFEVEALSGKEADGRNTHSYFVGKASGGAWVHNGNYIRPNIYEKLPVLGSSDRFCPDDLSDLMKGAPLKAGQETVFRQNVDRIADMMRRGTKFKDIEIEGATGAITDGNHRYIASRLTGTSIGASPRVPGIKLRAAVPWEQVDVR